MLRSVIAVLVLGLMLTACAAPSKTAPATGDVVAQFPVMQVGDSWTAYHHHDLFGTAKFTYRVTSVEPDGSFDISETNDRNSQRRFKHYDRHAEGVHMTIGLQFDPGALQFPLFVGKTWQSESRAPSVDGDYFTYRTRYRIETFGPVQTGVGTLDAFKIRGATKNLETNWSGVSYYWYSPAAKAVVSSSHRHTRGIKLVEMNLVE